MSTHSTTPKAEEQQFPGNDSLEKALEAIVNIYHQYSIRKGHQDLLNFNEFQTLLTEMAPNFLKVCGRNHPGYLKKLFEETDLNKDKELTFEEFTVVLAKVTDDAHRLMHNEDRCKPDSN
ncbi:protein S100-A12-like [Excalfactoria chinensis]|uniref:protein S100-A12-like n=1 Tax=Excalfactoria chinensis TaxID=46218 RepID=UPI003B3BD8AC